MNTTHYTTKYIYTLPRSTQLQIKAQLHNAALSKEDIQFAMNSRLCDLEDTIDISKIEIK